MVFYQVTETRQKDLPRRGHGRQKPSGPAWDPAPRAPKWLCSPPPPQGAHPQNGRMTVSPQDYRSRSWQGTSAARPCPLLPLPNRQNVNNTSAWNSSTHRAERLPSSRSRARHVLHAHTHRALHAHTKYPLHKHSRSIRQGMYADYTPALRRAFDTAHYHGALEGRRFCLQGTPGSVWGCLWLS